MSRSLESGGSEQAPIRYNGLAGPQSRVILQDILRSTSKPHIEKGFSLAVRPKLSPGKAYNRWGALRHSPSRSDDARLW